MRIVGLEETPRGIIMRAIVTQQELESLQGQLSDLIVFPKKSINTPASIMRTASVVAVATVFTFDAPMRFCNVFTWVSLKIRSDRIGAARLQRLLHSMLPGASWAGAAWGHTGPYGPWPI